jgi:hypothetical protein
MPDTFAQKLFKRAENAFNLDERTNIQALWRTQSEFLLNNQFMFDTSGSTVPDKHLKGSSSTRRLYSSEGPAAVQKLSSTMHSTLTNPATIWSKLEWENGLFSNNRMAGDALNQGNAQIHKRLNESNFNTEVGKFYQSFVTFGNGVLFFEVEQNDPFDKFNFTSIHLGSIAWAQNDMNEIDKCYRKFTMTAEQAGLRWGDAVPEGIKKALEKDDFDRSFDFIHVVIPRTKSNIDPITGLAAPKDRPFASYYIEQSEKVLLEESGYYEFPYFVARWSLTPGSVYAQGPSNIAMPDVRSLNSLLQLELESAALMVRPPLLVNQQFAFSEINMCPGGSTIVTDVNNAVAEFRSAGRMDVEEQTYQRLKASVERIYFLDQLLLPPRTEIGQMSVPEVSQRIEQINKVLGPAVSIIQNQILKPTILRAFNILYRAQSLGSQIFPQELIQFVDEIGFQNVKIEYVNSLARSQQMQDLITIQQWISNIGALAEITPEIIDNIDPDKLAKHTAKVLGVPDIVLRDDREIQAVRQQRAQQAQSQQAIEQANLAADTISKASKSGGGQL